MENTNVAEQPSVQSNAAEPKIEESSNTTVVKAEPSNQDNAAPDNTNSSPTPAPISGQNHSDVNAGAETRQWLNNEVTPALVESMRKIASEKPSDPVRALANHLLDYANSHPPPTNSST